MGGACWPGGGGVATRWAFAHACALAKKGQQVRARGKGGGRGGGEAVPCLAPKRGKPVQ